MSTDCHHVPVEPCDAEITFVFSFFIANSDDTTLRYATLHFATLHYTTLHYTKHCLEHMRKSQRTSVWVTELSI